MRPILSEENIHPTIRDQVNEHHGGLLKEVQDAVANNDVVVVGMAQNPFPKKARKALTEKGVPFKYLEYGSYWSKWRPRTAIKMWTGWPTFPMIFVKGTLIGGFKELQTLLDSGKLKKMLG